MQTPNRILSVLLAVLVLALGASLAVAQTPQTIVIDGINDFLPGNLVEDDGGDTQHPNIDIGEVYMTNDAVNLYLGLEHDPAGWGSVQIGLAIDVNTADGGTTDPWGRQLEWSLAPLKPDFMFYINLDNNWQASYLWDGAGWVNIVQGPGALNWNTGSGFNELAIMLGSLGVSASDVINYDAWITQDGGTKGPLDAVANDASQLSTPGFTMWDTDSPIPMLELLPYTVQAAADPNPPVVQNVQPADYPVDSFFDVFFNEPISAGSVQPADFVLSAGDGVAHTVVGATVDGGDPSIVHLEFGSDLAAAGALYALTVNDVTDNAGNVIENNGTDNVAEFMLKEVVFRGKFGFFLAGQEPPHEFSVEGGFAPLTWDLCDNAMMTDTGVDDIWEYSTIFCVNGSTQDVEWKFVYDCSVYEPLAGNRLHTLDVANGAQDIIEVWWNNDDPTSFTQHDIDVEFFVDMSDSDFLMGDIVSINGAVAPLTFDVPSVNDLVDDGTGNDAVAGDMIFSTTITFPAGSYKDVAYKFLMNGEYECDLQGDRTVFLNDEVYGGGNGPLVLPVVHYDFCNTLFRAVEVIFSVDMSAEGISGADVVGVNGTPNNADPATFDWTIPSLNTLLDDGVAPDAVAGDMIYTTSVVFPDTSVQNIEYKFLLNDQYECQDLPNRTLSIDPETYDAVGNPQVVELAVFDVCGGASPVLPGQVSMIELMQNMPNPFNPSTEIRFSVPKAGEGSLRVYNMRGELVRTLRDGHFEAGAGSVVWNGKTDAGMNAGSGVYFYRLEVAGDAAARRMVLLK